MIGWTNYACANQILVYLNYYTINLKTNLMHAMVLYLFSALTIITTNYWCVELHIIHCTTNMLILPVDR